MLVEKSETFSCDLQGLQDTTYTMGLNVSYKKTKVQNLRAETPDLPVLVKSSIMERVDEFINLGYKESLNGQQTRCSSTNRSHCLLHVSTMMLPIFPGPIRST